MVVLEYNYFNILIYILFDNFVTIQFVLFAIEMVIYSIADSRVHTGDDFDFGDVLFIYLHFNRLHIH